MSTMNESNNITAKEQVSKIKIPSSVLLIGNISQAEEIVKEIIANYQILPEDVIRISPADSEGKTESIGIKQIREMEHFLFLTPAGSVKAAIIEQADHISAQAANAMLKTLEEPPGYALIILISGSDNLLPTIISRCKRYYLGNNNVDIENDFDIEKLINDPFWAQSQMIESIVKENQELQFLKELEAWQRKKMRLSLLLSDSQNIKDIIITRRQILANVSARVALECLILKLCQNKSMQN